MVVLGDSYAQGWELPDPMLSWVSTFAEDFAATVTVDAHSGTGFVTARFGVDAFVDRARRLPCADLTIVQGGLNDVGAAADAIAAAVEQVVVAIDGPVVVVGPPAIPGRPLEDVRAVDAVLRDGAPRYVSTLDWPLDLVDDIHLTPAGHADFGRRVASAVRAA